MDVAEFLTRTSYALQGTDDAVPDFDDDTGAYWLSLLNRKKDEFFQTTSEKWSETFYETAPNEPGTVATTATTTLTGTSTYFTDYRAGDKITVDGETERTIATITSNTVLTVTLAFSNTASSKTFTHKSIIATSDQTYSLHRSFLLPSDRAYTTNSSSQRTYYDIIHPQERDTNRREVFITGVNPKVLNFSSDIVSTEPIVGTTLTVPGYYLPNDLTAETDILPFRDPNWAVLAVAAEVAFNDVVYEDKAPELNNKANALYRAMVTQNRAGTYSNPRRTPYAGYRISSPSRRR